MMKGSCACGAVAFEADAPPSPIAFCNCRTCRKINGTAVGANMSISRRAFRWVRGEERLTSYESSPGKIRRFCSACGSPMVAERPGDRDAPLRVRLGALDTKIENPTFVGHIWRSQGADWFDPKRDTAEWAEFAEG